MCRCYQTVARNNAERVREWMDLVSTVEKSDLKDTV